MSDDERSGSSSDGEDLGTTGLIATRAKRSTAGNLYATLRQNLDDEELQKELLAEDEEDQGEYEGSDKDDDDEAMDSSSDEEDAGPPKDGEKEDLEGEKELKKAERAEVRKKRKMQEAKMRLPAWQKKQKKQVKLADDVKAEDGAPQRPKKKSERSNWLPSAADAPVRQSARASAIANREVVHSNLKDYIQRSEKQKKVMENAAKREKANKRAELTQEERLAKAARIEKETAREFGRWEREEAERQRLREEQLAAKRKRGLDGPVIRQWSGSVLWEGDKIKVKRLHGSRNVDEAKDEARPGSSKGADGDVAMGSTTGTATPDTGLASWNPRPHRTSDTPNAQPSQTTAPTASTTQPHITPFTQQAPTQQTALNGQQPQSPAPMSWLDGIQEYASQPASATPPPPQTAQLPLQPNPYTPSAPAINGAPSPTYQPTHPIAPQSPSHIQNPRQSAPPPQVYHGWPPGYQEWSLQRPQVPLPPAPPTPLIKEQAQRSLIMLEQFENLETSATTSKRGTTKTSGKDATLDPTPLAATLLPSSYPSFTPEETRYLTTRMKRRGNEHWIPVAPSKVKCALTSWPAKFRDPKTGLPYADLPTFKMIQRLLAGGCQWSGLLGVWVGPCYGQMGRPAKGVPEAFAAPGGVRVDAEVKSEGAT